MSRLDREPPQPPEHGPEDPNVLGLVAFAFVMLVSLGALLVMILLVTGG